ncbi:metallophosphoesterase family protein [Tuwongella immobilis]|uniref:Nuclease SbcCD subunit D n=1 Tax=Tuwongella immobilis TaxID=692036 RepID=A0A6C2YK74_9BACT|nr:exonuclease SbcCD subunit D [Tuwongella immobilis]VIP01629.1 nuclease subunit d : Exonuclease SbcD OS=Tolypothrix bouteillei VB521301 GN=DA73_01685 PE=4 SV=1: Metallophos_2 [Tuwongella immobilis]VTR98975.1 nuclease subunit d : Exonuclease SbcD OS=Tolypothrix bouteillei VB521301 GN=DA73_01685 PE=4 SV=1: Metallophos_2 [Tuwongella immobilis]
MRILHTADWHLGDKLHGYSRSEELHAQVERIVQLAINRAADVLLIAGDLFAEFLRPREIDAELQFLSKAFRLYLQTGGVILAVTGNHDRPPYPDIIRTTMGLSSPLSQGDVIQPGRFVLTNRAMLGQVASVHSGRSVQFLLMPYPTPGNYLDAEEQALDREQVNRRLRDTFVQQLTKFTTHAKFRVDLPTVMMSHFAVEGVSPNSLFRLTEQQDVLLPLGNLPSAWAYVALGHIHQAQALPGMAHMHYSGSIARLDFGEMHDEKSVTLVEVGPYGLEGAIERIPLPCNELRSIEFDDPETSTEQLRELVPDWESAIVRVMFQGDPRHDGVRRARAKAAFPRVIFPRRQPIATEQVSGPAIEVHRNSQASDHDGIVRYLDSQVSDAAERAALLQLLPQILRQVSQ